MAFAEEDNCESQRQRNSDECEQLKCRLQETETQNKQSAKDANPTVMGNNNKGSIASFSEVLLSQNLIADAERKDDTTTIDTQIDCNSIDPLSEVFQKKKRMRQQLTCSLIMMALIVLQSQSSIVALL